MKNLSENLSQAPIYGGLSLIAIGLASTVAAIIKPELALYICGGSAILGLSTFFLSLTISSNKIIQKYENENRQLDWAAREQTTRFLIKKGIIRQ